MPKLFKRVGNKVQVTVCYHYKALLGVGIIACGISGAPHETFGQAAPANDNFTNAVQLTGTNVQVFGSNVGATKEPGEPLHAGNSGGKSVWWFWQAAETGYLTASTRGSTSSYGDELDTELAIYTGTNVANLTAIASNDDGPFDYTSQVIFQVNAGTVYRIAVDGYSSGTPAQADMGSIMLTLRFSTTLPPAPPWNLPGIYSSMVSSSDFAGKVVLLNFWATWCGPCINETPDLIALHEKYSPDGFSVVGISVDNAEGGNPPYDTVSNFVWNYGIPYPVAMSRPFGYDVENNYGGIPYIPDTFIIDRQNHIIQTFVGTQTFATFERAVLPLIYSNLKLNITISGGQAHIYWPLTQATFRVESTTNLSSGVWGLVSASVQSDGTTQFIDVPLGAKQFFRLRSQ